MDYCCCRNDGVRQFQLFVMPPKANGLEDDRFEEINYSCVSNKLPYISIQILITCYPAKNFYSGDYGYHTVSLHCNVH